MPSYTMYDAKWGPTTASSAHGWDASSQSCGVATPTTWIYGPCGVNWKDQSKWRGLYIRQSATEFRWVHDEPLDTSLTAVTTFTVCR